MVDLNKTLNIAASGMRAQSHRMRVVAENIANANSTASSPDSDPYRRKIVTFANVLDREMGVKMLEVDGVIYDKKPFGRKYDPGHPGADEQGYVRMPNINALIEMTDMREAQRSYQANLSIIGIAKDMLSRTVALLQ
ncbi:MAG: flagellar basal body rod protein FlgC [Alphaproteobacteria bacterium]|nr:flagellar basal body rod protein FlgC [Alphaproteobacteria bacterium]